MRRKNATHLRAGRPAACIPQGWVGARDGMRVGGDELRIRSDTPAYPPGATTPATRAHREDAENAEERQGPPELQVPGADPPEAALLLRVPPRSPRLRGAP